MKSFGKDRLKKTADEAGTGRAVVAAVDVDVGSHWIEIWEIERPVHMPGRREEARMSRLQRMSLNRAAIKEDAEEALRPTLRVNRRKSRTERASDAGVWISALYLAVVSCLMPAWFLGVGLALANGGGVEAATVARGGQIALLGLGTVATWFGLRACFTLSNAPRLGRGPHRTAMRRVPIVAGVLSIVFLHRFVYNAPALASDFLAYVGAMAPAVLLSEVSWALPAISRRRHGTLIGAKGALAWGAAGFSLIPAGFAPGLWWLPVACALAGSICTALAAVRIWRHYEGEVVTG